jgi:hypothetical protein
VRHLGYDAHIELFDVPAVKTQISQSDIEHTRIRLCLPPERDTEIEEVLRERPVLPRSLATIWWDVH